MSVFHNNILSGAAGSGGAAGFQIDRSLRFNDDDSAYLSKVFASTGDRKKWTWSGWAKRSTANNTTNLLFYAEPSVSAYTQIGWSGDNFQLNIAYSGTSFAYIRASAESRDVSAWAHYVVVYDSANATSTDRMILYINGTRVTDFAISSFPSQNALSPLNRNTTHYIGTRKNVNQYFDGSLAEVHFIDGQALAPTDFGESDADTGVWNPIEYAGTYGTNGFHLDFSDNTSTTTIGEDSSGNNNDFTANNISVTAGADNDSLIDTPTNYTADSGNNGGNYCTLNPFHNSGVTLSNGNLDITGVSGWKGAAGTLGMSSGKWYFEYGNVASNEHIIGIVPASTGTLSTASSYGYGSETGGKYSPSASNVSYGSSWTTGDVIGVAFDADAGSLYFYKNNTIQNSGTAAFTGLTDGPYLPSAVLNGTSKSASLNFGQRPFAYTPPSGYKSLCTQNLDDPTIADPSTAMDTLLYTGNGSTQTITGLDFSPDLLWIKNRSAAFSHVLFDKLRVSDGSGGDVNGASKELFPDLTNTESNLGYVTLTNDGFTLGVADSSLNAANNYVAWAWDAGSSTASNSNGSITSSVRANASAGFSIVSYTGNGSTGTVGHGLGVSPDFYVVKERSDTSHWYIYHKGMGATKTIRLNENFAQATDDIWQDTAPSSTVFYLSQDTATNQSSQTYIAYCFAEVEGYSKFGSYTGNGSSGDGGTFVYTGFRPAFVMTKRIDSTGSWYMFDSKRDGYNETEPYVIANASNVEATDLGWDLLSNGFKHRTNYIEQNTSNGSYIYMAWAEHPFKTARAR